MLERGRFYLTMDYIEGETLTDQLVQSPDGLPQEMLVERGAQICYLYDCFPSLSPCRAVWRCGRVPLL